MDAVSFTAHWKKVTGAKNYIIDVALDEEFTQIINNYNNKIVETISIIINDLEANTTYFYRVRASIANKTSNNSNVIEVSTTSLNTPIVYPATEATSTGFRAHWKTMPLATVYLLDIATDSDFKNLLTDYSSKEIARDTSLLVSNVKVNQLFFYRIRIKQSKSFSKYSNTQSVFTSELPQPVVLAPTNAELTSFVANWETMPEAASYRIDVSTDPLFQQMLPGHNDQTVNINSLVIANLDANTEYYYRVRAVNNQATSNHSEVMPAKTINIGTPVAIQASDVQNGSFKANWDATDNAASYLLDVALDQNFTQILTGYNNLAVVNNDVNILSLDASTTYYYRVRAQGLNAVSDYSNVIELTTSSLAAPVTNAATNPKAFGFTINWQAQSGIDVYLLDVATDAGFTSFVAGYQNKEVAGTSHTITNLDYKATHYYRLRAKRLTKVSDYSNTIQVASCISATCRITDLKFYTGSDMDENTQRFTYNAQNKLIVINFPLSDTSYEITYNTDNTVQTVKFFSSGWVLEEYVYTYTNNLLESIQSNDDSGNFNQLWTFTYNGKNQRTSWRVYSDLAKTILDQQFDYTLDAKGNVIKMADSETNTTEYFYDDKLSPYVTFNPDLCFFIATSRDNWLDFHNYRGFLPIHNIIKDKITTDIDSSSEVYLFNYNDKDISISQDGFYNSTYTLTGCSF